MLVDVALRGADVRVAGVGLHLFDLRAGADRDRAAGVPERVGADPVQPSQISSSSVFQSSSGQKARAAVRFTTM